MIHVFIIIISLLLSTKLHSNYSIIMIDNNLTQNNEFLKDITGCSSKLLLSAVQDWSIKNFWYKFYYSDDGGTSWSKIRALEKYENSDYEYVGFHRSNFNEITLFCNKHSKKIQANDTILFKHGVFLKSKNLGDDFDEVILPDSISLGMVKMINLTNGYILGNRYVLLTKDNWSSYSYIETPYFTIH